MLLHNHISKQNRADHSAKAAVLPASRRHGGAVIIMVVSLMTTLVVIGLFFYSWTQQELVSSRTFATKKPLEFDPDPVFDFGLQQVLVSTPSTYTNSALYGSRWSLAAHIMGPLNPDGSPRQAHPYSGTGITVTSTGGSSFDVDYNGDGTIDRNETNFVVNFSPLANGGADLFTTTPDLRFNPAAGYTYPDINSLFLSLDYVDSITGERVVKPSFALPGYFPGFTFANWYTAGPANRVMRPHDDLTDRYVTNANGENAQSGDQDRLIEPFPFPNPRLGVWDGATSSYELDVDLDGDGLKESILVDLDHPMVELPNGRQVVPVYSFKITDLDGLLNTNVHGNMSDFVRRSRVSTGEAGIYEHIGNKSTWVHSSNLGLTPSEVNPLIAMYADPSSADFIEQDNNLKGYITFPHRGMAARRFDGTSLVDPPVNRIGVGSFNHLTTANLEWAMISLGRPDFNPSDLRYMATSGTDRLNGVVPGRYGLDSGQLLTGLNNEGPTPAMGRFNAPGNDRVDEDEDRNNGTTPGGGVLYTDPSIGVDIPPFVHPLDFGGTGNHIPDLGTPTNVASIVYRTMGVGTIGERILEAGGLTNNPMRWPSYPAQGAWQNQGSGNPNYPTYQDAISVGALQKSSTDMLVDEEDERVVDLAFPDVNDARFPPSEIAAMHLSESDWSGTKSTSRLRALAPFNFEFNRQASKIRSQFTTESWDRLQFAFSPFPSTAGERAWEFNDNLDSDDRFPPQFGTVQPSRHENGAISPRDPFRPEIRRLLTIRNTGWANQNSAFPQRKLHLNRILSDDAIFDTSANDAFDDNSNPQYRNLVPHAIEFYDSTGTPLGTETYINTAIPHDNVLDGTGLPPFANISTDPFVQEWWARYDRQRLARDIYVLLYTLAGNDGTGTNIDPAFATSPVNVAIDPDVAKEMAQFAVNYVDALDRDDVITEFVYDPDLSDGWDNAPTEAVYGIESQKLSFSEVMLIETDVIASDSGRTLHDDTGIGGNGHRFLYMELRNLSPFDINLNDESWRIARVSTVGGNEVVDMAVEFKEDAGGTARVIPAGENFLLACHDGTVVNGSGQSIGSEFYVNIDDDQSSSPLQLIYPKSNTTVQIPNNNQTPDPVVDLDLTPRTGFPHEDFRTFGGKDASSTYTGSTLVEQTANGDSGPAFTLLLQRRKNLRGQGAGESDWIEVDRFTVIPNDYRQSGNRFLTTHTAPISPNQSQLQAELRGMHSQERLHPYTHDRDNHPFFDDSGSDANNSERNHTLRTATHPDKNRANQRWIEDFGNVEFWFWQPHFDRDFSSVIELLSIPRYGNRSAGSTSAAADYLRLINGGVIGNLTENTNHDTLEASRVAQVRFLATDQRWSRLLNFIETPPRTQDVIKNDLYWQRRTPGRVNLNMIRHEHVLAGLIDDTVHHDPLAARPTQDFIEPLRDWMDEFQDSRDVRRAGGIPTGTSLPGSHQARPFRPLGYVHPGSPNQSRQHTILRRNINNNPPDLNSLGIFEARPTTDVGTNTIDYHTRQRILAKVANNSTTRSHVFAMWVGIDLHEAHINGGNVKLGDVAGDLPRYRMFCVVDMSRIEEAYDPNRGTFDFRKFIIHRQLLP